MGKKKLQRFAETDTFPHFVQVSFAEAVGGFRLQGRWANEFFRNSNPLVLELGCGKGEYTVGLARKYPDRNFIGVDIKGARMWRGAKTSMQESLANVAFLRTRIELIGHFFGPQEVDEIWITFPDPQLKVSRGKKRLTHPQFLNRYKGMLKDHHVIHLKTDSIPLYQYTLALVQHNGYELLYNTSDLYADRPDDEASLFQTFYEKMWLDQGLKINYLRFRMDLSREAVSIADAIENQIFHAEG